MKEASQYRLSEPAKEFLSQALGEYPTALRDEKVKKFISLAAEILHDFGKEVSYDGPWENGLAHETPDVPVFVNGRTFNILLRDIKGGPEEPLTYQILTYKSSKPVVVCEVNEEVFRTANRGDLASIEDMDKALDILPFMKIWLWGTRPPERKSFIP